jgi:quercetin dioxygenase-like cupin family protein
LQAFNAYRAQGFTIRILGGGFMETLVGKKRNLLDLADYQQEAIVSRTIMDLKSGTVTLFAFDQGQGLSEHTAPFDALVQLLEGEAEVRIGDERFLLRGGDMIIMPAHEPHELKAVGRFKMLLTMIRSQ